MKLCLIAITFGVTVLYAGDAENKAAAAALEKYKKLGAALKSVNGGIEELNKQFNVLKNQAAELKKQQQALKDQMVTAQTGLSKIDALTTTFQKDEESASSEVQKAITAAKLAQMTIQEELVEKKLETDFKSASDSLKKDAAATANQFINVKKLAIDLAG